MWGCLETDVPALITGVNDQTGSLARSDMDNMQVVTMSGEN
jgi:hypothetical protein